MDRARKDSQSQNIGAMVGYVVVRYPLLSRMKLGGPP